MRSVNSALEFVRSFVEEFFYLLIHLILWRDLTLLNQLQTLWFQLFQMLNMLLNKSEFCFSFLWHSFPKRLQLFSESWLPSLALNCYNICCISIWFPWGFKDNSYGCIIPTWQRFLKVCFFKENAQIHTESNLSFLYDIKMHDKLLPETFQKHWSKYKTVLIEKKCNIVINCNTYTLK